MAGERVVPGHGSLACSLARALGLDPSRVKKFAVVVEPDSLVTFYVKGVVSEKAMSEMESGFRHHSPAVVVKEVPGFEVTDECEVVVNDAGH
jgi:hypothetical protein